MIKPTGNWVLIEELPSIKISDAGIMFPDGYDRYRHGHMDYRVIGVGPKADQEIQPGQLCVLDQFRCQAKQEAGPGQWLVQDSSIAIVVPTGTKS